MKMKLKSRIYSVSKNFKKIKNKKLRWPIAHRSARHNGGQRIDERIGQRSPIFSSKRRWPIPMVRLADRLATRIG